MVQCFDLVGQFVVIYVVDQWQQVIVQFDFQFVNGKVVFDWCIFWCYFFFLGCFCCDVCGFFFGGFFFLDILVYLGQCVGIGGYYCEGDEWYVWQNVYNQGDIGDQVQVLWIGCQLVEDSFVCFIIYIGFGDQQVCSD